MSAPDRSPVIDCLTSKKHHLVTFNSYTFTYINSASYCSKTDIVIIKHFSTLL